MTPKQLAITSAATIVLGCLIAWIGTAIWLDAVGITLGGIGFVGVISAAFYAVGQSEDRERAREEAARHERGSGPPS
jgi:1,4-dihydroxy-2-naphthoate octaprenyltransferase